MRGRPLATLVAALTTLVAALPLMTLMETNAWFGVATALVALVAAIGYAGRMLRLSPWLVLLLQAALAWLAGVWRYGAFDGFGTLGAADALVHGGLDTIQQYAAPAPERDGIAFILSLVVVAAAILVDHLAAARRSPAAAGFPLLVVFLVSAVNTAGGLPWYYFAGLATTWLFMIGAEAARSVSRLVGGHRARASGGRSDDPADAAVDAFANRSRALAVGAVLLALLGQLLLPQVPTRFIGPGRGRAPSGTTASTTTGFRSEVDVSRDLAAQDPTAVFTFTTDDPQPGPFAVAVADHFEAGHWVVQDAQPEPRTGVRLRPDVDAEPLSEVAGATTPTARHHLVVTDNTVQAPQLAASGWTLRAAGITGRRLAAGVVSVERPASRYDLTYTTMTPRQSDLDAGPSSAALPVPDEDLAVDPASETTVRRLAERLAHDPAYTVGKPGTPFHTAMALQQYLREGPFTYSLSLAAANGRDPVTAFLETRRGYCVQFATAMALLARSQGIPARVRLGFLPGSMGPKQVWTVHRADAHMWPELYLPGTGWTRFEPTPGGRSGQPPAWAQLPSTDPTRDPSSDPTHAPTPTSTTPSATAASSPTADVGATSATGATRRIDPLVVLGLCTILLAGLLVALTPALAWWARRRRLALADDAASRAEAQWRTLREQLADLGVRFPSHLTFTQARSAVASDADLPAPARARLGEVLSAMERIHYAPTTNRTVLDTSGIVPVIAARRSWRRRIRAILLPSAGVDVWRSLGRR